MVKYILRFLSFILLFLSTTLAAQMNNTYRTIVVHNYLKTSFNSELKHSKLKPSFQVILNNNDTIAFVYSLNPKGFIIISPSKNLNPIIAFSTETDFDFTQSLENILLEMLKRDIPQRIASLENMSFQAKANNQSIWNSLSNPISTTKSYDTQYGPLLSSKWGGVNCLDDFWMPINVGNYYTPNHYSPGCVATATSIIMHYYKWPLQGVGKHSDYDNKGNSQGSYYANFGATKYQWGIMQNLYNLKKSKEKNRKAMGLLSYHCAIAFDTDFEYGGSTSNLNRTPLALDNYFRFSGHYKSSSWYSFWPRLRENIRNSQPVSIAISKTNGDGHAMVCDGYGQDVGKAKYYHLQFGWWGSYNGWYNLQGNWDASGYTIIDGAVFDILPDPIVGNPIFSNDEYDFTIPILVSDSLHWESFKIWQSYNGSNYKLIESNFQGLNYKPNITKSGLYKYKVQAKVNGTYFSNSTSLPQEVLVKSKSDSLISLDFDGDDSFFVNDNSFSNLDISDSYTIETWMKVNKLNPTSNFDVIMDRRTVFSLYLIDDNDADYAIRFVSRNGSDALTASLGSDNSDINLNFDEWVHIAICRSEGITSLFLNGEEVDHSLDTNFKLRYSIYALNFGARYWGSYQRYMYGELDEVRISDTARYVHKQNFRPYRCMPFQNDEYCILLLHLDENSGNCLGDDSRHFFNTKLRSNPHFPNWRREKQEQSVVYEKSLSLKTEEENIGQSITLSWATNYEKNNEGFEVLKSVDHYNWKYLGFVKGSYYSQNILTYKFKDQNPKIGINYYQLKQIHSHCKFTFSPTDSIALIPKDGLKIYPNPASNIFYIDGLVGKSIKHITLINTLGISLELQLKSNYSIDISPFAQGVYYIRIELEQETIIKKLIISRLKQ